MKTFNFYLLVHRNEWGGVYIKDIKMNEIFQEMWPGPGLDTAKLTNLLTVIRWALNCHYPGDYRSIGACFLDKPER